VRFRMKLKAIRRKELPELNDEFAKDLGDFNTLEELRDAVRKSIFREREQAAQQKAKAELVDRMVEAHDFPVPETFLDRQIENMLETQARQWAAQGVDVSKIKIDWAKLKESQRAKAIHDVKARLLIDRVAERESINPTQDEVDREVQGIARQEREPVAAVRRKLEKSGGMGQIAGHIRTEKTLNFLFEHARKVAGEAEPPAAEE
jgi:trigger factor